MLYGLNNRIKYPSIDKVHNMVTSGISFTQKVCTLRSSKKLITLKIKLGG